MVFLTVEEIINRLQGINGYEDHTNWVNSEILTWESRSNLLLSKEVSMTAYTHTTIYDIKFALQDCFSLDVRNQRLLLNKIQLTNAEYLSTCCDAPLPSLILIPRLSGNGKLLQKYVNRINRRVISSSTRSNSSLPSQQNYSTLNNN